MSASSIVRSWLAMGLVLSSSSPLLAQQLGPGLQQKPETGAKASPAPTALTVLTGGKSKCARVLGRAPLASQCRPSLR